MEFSDHHNGVPFQALLSPERERSRGWKNNLICLELFGFTESLSQDRGRVDEAQGWQPATPAAPLLDASISTPTCMPPYHVQFEAGPFEEHGPAHLDDSQQRDRIEPRRTSPLSQQRRVQASSTRLWPDG